MAKPRLIPREPGTRAVKLVQQSRKSRQVRAVPCEVVRSVVLANGVRVTLWREVPE